MFETHSKKRVFPRKKVETFPTVREGKVLHPTIQILRKWKFSGNSTRKFPQQILIWNETREKLAKHIPLFGHKFFVEFDENTRASTRIWLKSISSALSAQGIYMYIRNNKICNFDLLKFVQSIQMRAQESKCGERQEIYIERTQRKLKMHFSSTQNRIHLALTHTWRDMGDERESERVKMEKREKFIVEVQWTANKSHKRTSCTCFNELYFEDKLYKIEWVILDFN